MKLAISPEFRQLLAILASYKGRYTLGCLFLVGTDVGQLAVPWLIGRVVDGLTAHTLDEAGVRLYAWGIVASALWVAACRLGWRAFVFGTARRIERDLRQKLYEHLQALSLAFHLRHKVGDLMAHATNDVGAIRAVAGEGVMAGFDGFAMALGALIMLVGTVDWRLGLAAALPLLLLGPCTYAMGRRSQQAHRELQGAYSLLSDRAQEGFAGVRVVKGFAREEHQQAQFAEANEAYRQAYKRMSLVDAGFDPLTNVLAGLAWAIGLGYGGYLVVQGQLTVGQYVAFNTFLGMLSWPMLAVGWTMNLVQRALASVGRLQRLFEQQPAVVDGPLHLPAARGALAVKGLSFRYAPELPDVLCDVSLEAAPGETIGIMGGTGAGKTTLANLLIRLFDPPRGRVFLDGIDVNDLNLADLRGAIAYVPQDGFLFSRTIEENVAFSPRDHAPERVREAARHAQLDGDVQAFPHGYGTMLGERGVTLSGGQRQRVGIARALLKDAPVLVLDDCLSAVDTDTEARLLAALKEHMAGRTTLLISHRTSTLQHCDEVLVLAEGRVVERGRHEQLLALDGEYARVHRRQQLEAALEGL